MSVSCLSTALAAPLDRVADPLPPTLDSTAILNDYLARQAATVGRRARPDGRNLWAPRLADADGSCLGVLKGKGNIAAGSVAIYPDGQTLVTGDPLGTVCRWDLAGRTPMRPFSGQHSTQIQDIAVAANGHLLATAASGGTLRVWSIASEQELLCCRGHNKEVLQVSWAPDSVRLVSASADTSVRVWDALTGRCLLHCNGHQDRVYCVQWSPDGRWLASGSADQSARIWDASNGACLQQLWLPDSTVESLHWSPDSRWLATAGDDNQIRIWDTQTWRVVLCWEAHAQAHYLSCLAWSPDGRLLASGAHGDCRLYLWEVATGQQLACFETPERYTWRLAWAPNGAFLASKHAGAVCRLWDTRHLLAQPQAVALRPLPPDLAVLPAALAHLHRLHLYPPLSLLHALLRLTGGQPVAGPLTTLADQAGVRALVGLRWPTAARVGLVALLLRELPLTGWQPPVNLAGTELRDRLGAVLAEDSIPPCPPIIPLTALMQAVDRIDERLLTLLELLGPAAVASDPGLPLRLSQRLPTLPPLRQPQRRLLSLRLPRDGGGPAQGGGGSDRSGVDRQGTLRDLLPSQLALPPAVLHSRYRRRELLYRARSGREVPQLRPAVLVLDVSPACFGPVEGITRLVAHLITASLLDHGLPVGLLAAGGDEVVRLPTRAADLVELWTLRSLEPASAARVLRRAQGLRQTLRDGPLEPFILVLSHVWFGSGVTLPPLGGLRGLFVQLPGATPRPPLAAACERWECVTTATLPPLDRLAWLLG